jgi:O-antigen ligase
MQPPEVNGALGTIVFIIFLLIFVLGIVGRIVTDRRGGDRLAKKMGGKISTLFVTMGLAGIILFFFSFESVQLFGARFWYPLWVIATLVWAFFVLRFIKHDVPLMRKMALQHQTRDQYLPGRKK